MQATQVQLTVLICEYHKVYDVQVVKTKWKKFKNTTSGR